MYYQIKGEHDTHDIYVGAILSALTVSRRFIHTCDPSKGEQTGYICLCDSFRIDGFVPVRQAIGIFILFSDFDSFGFRAAVLVCVCVPSGANLS